jgi:hypothetical protein
VAEVVILPGLNLSVDYCSNFLALLAFLGVGNVLDRGLSMTV